MKPDEFFRAAVEFWFGNRYRLDDYVISDGKKHPFVLICPGGGYMMVSGVHEGKDYAQELNKCGYSAFVLHYGCRRKARYPGALDDVAKALRDIIERADKLGLDTENYFLWGSSAGGHLAASFATERMGFAQFGLPKPSALVLAYPVITMGELTHKWSRYNLLGVHPSKEMIELTSVEKHITKDFPPTYVWCGNADTLVDPRNSELLAQALYMEDVPCVFRKFPGVEHGVGFGKGLDCEGWFDEAVNFIENNSHIKKTTSQ